MSQTEIDAIAEQKEEMFREYIKDNIQPFPSVVETIETLAAAEFQLAIVSSATIENIRLITEKLHINSFFNWFVTGKDVMVGKPNPQGFLMAADKLGVKPLELAPSLKMQSLVSELLRRAACIASLSPIHAPNSDYLNAEADMVVDSLDELKELTFY